MHVVNDCISYSPMRGDEGGINWEKVMAASFAKMDEEINVEANEIDDMSASSLLRSMGSTAAVVVVGVHKFIVANCGDSRAVLYCNGVAVPLSRDHKVMCLLSTLSISFSFPLEFLSRQTHLTL